MSATFRGINQIEVSRYKSIKNLNVEFGAITVLAGANSSGKSSMMQPLLLMKQTLDMNSNSALLLQGKNVDLTSFEQIRTRVSGSENDSFSVRVQVGNFSAQSTFTGNEDEIFLDSTHYYFVDQTPEGKNREIELSRHTPLDKLREWVVRTYSGFERIEEGDCPFHPHLGACFHGISYKQIEGNEPTISPVLRPSEFFVQPDIQGIIHLPGLRDNPQRRDKKVSLEQQPYFRECFPKYTASVVASWEPQNNGKHAELLRCLNEMRLATDIKTEIRGSNHIELMVSRLVPQRDTDSNDDSADDFVSIADVGFGVSQALPIITSLIVAQENQIVYVEQPETHLHPYAQIGLVRAIINAAYRGVKVVVETHSATFLLALQTMIAETISDNQSLLHDKIHLYWFYQDKYGVTHHDYRVMEENGTFGDWIVDFSNVTMDLQMRFMEAFDIRENGKN